METENNPPENEPPKEEPPKEESPKEEPPKEEGQQEEQKEEANQNQNEPPKEEKKENLETETHPHNEEEEEEEFADIMGPKKPNFEYPEGYKEKEIKDVDLPNKLSQLYEILGQDAQKRYNCYFLNDREILMAVANTFQIFNIETKERKIFPSTEVGGVGAIAKHPSEQVFAVGECGYFPNIYIYKYVDDKVKLHRILRKGTEQAYSALTFYSKGEKLASVGSEPDYNLVIWNWQRETIILKAKAFSQEIFRVSFSENFEGKLITCGMGHIRFWEMATTFTGLKLQGELGKFGQIDLSDISSFVEFPDGKVLCGTEHGTLLLWEGIFVKANLSEPEGKKCHVGLVEHMSWEALDDKRFKLIDKIRANEKQKEKYINQIDLCLPVSLDQFHQIDVDGKTKLELGQAIYIDTAKSKKLDKALEEIIKTNHQYEKEEKLFTSDFDIKIRDKRNLEKKYKDIETVFKNEQILKFGLEIDFNFLLQANKKTTVDRYESEYKKLKMESDRKVDLYKQKIAEAKRTLQEETNNNTEELKKIMEKLQDKQKNDKKLEEKNSEITKKNSKKFVMYDLKEKKIKLKEILKLLKQQMDALKREIDIFRRKGGHIYSTIASNLV